MSPQDTRTVPLSERTHEPSYLALYHRGILQQRAAEAIERLARCDVCPRRCLIDRLANQQSYCKTGRRARVSSAFPHMGEENCLRGWSGSGTIFFARCNLKCVFCQNYDISHEGMGNETSTERLASLMLKLQSMSCHNINVVTPSHVVPQILEALVLAVDQGLRLPLVYNTSAYDTVETLQLLDGVVDIYMPDFKFWDAEHARHYLNARDYPDVARAALREMHRQVGDLQIDPRGLAQRGLLVRHLVMPGMLDNTRAILHFLAHELSPDTYINIMAQYHPSGEVTATQDPELHRRVSRNDYTEALAIAREVGLTRLDHR